MPKFRFIGFLAFLTAATAFPASPPAKNPPARVVVEPAATSVYLGRVTLTMPEFALRQPAYESTYEARVFPFFFLNEKGRIAIEVPEQLWQDIPIGAKIPVRGQAVNESGKKRQIEGVAIFDDAEGGKIKVRVRISKQIELVFNTTFRLPGGCPVAQTASAQ